MEKKMAGNKEIRNKIKSVQNTRKITKAMEMVAASKMRRAQERMHQARPYAHKIRNIVAHLLEALESDYVHPFMRALPTELKKVGVIAISTDKGLCGGLNTNMLRVLTQKMREFSEKKTAVQFATIGAKVTQFIARSGANLASQTTHLGDVPHLDKIIGTITQQINAFLQGEVDAVYLAYTDFINTMKQEPVFTQLLPIPADLLSQTDADRLNYRWEYLYEPDAQSVIDLLLKRYVESQVYQGLVENMASEQSARMVAMKSASDNAKSVISELQLEYNKSRQASITKELSEIVSGAAAVA